MQDKTPQPEKGTSSQSGGIWRAGAVMAVIVSLLTVGFFCQPIPAQIDISASLAGIVADQNGGVVPGASVSAQNVHTGAISTTISNETGYYQFASLQAGTYTVSCVVNGFKTFTAKDVVLHAGGAASLPIALQVGVNTETITVSGSTAMVDTETASNLTTIDNELIQGIPVLGRDPRESMETLMPGATAAGTGASFFIPVTSFNGVSQLSNNYNIDGAAMNDYMHGSAAAHYPQSENISEFSVESILPDASVGRGAGGQTEATLKSGTNQFHGQFWTYFQNGAWNANSWSNKWQGVHRQPFSQKWYGGNIGGPVILPKLYRGTEKTFFFASYERTGTSKKSTTTGQTITDAERSGDFTNSPDGIPVINGVPTPIIPQSHFSTLGKLINSDKGKQIMPQPTSGTDTFSWNPSYNDVVQTWVFRIDENISDKHRLFGSLYWYNDNSTFDDMYDEFSEASWATQYPNPDATWGEPIKTQVWALNDTYTISPSKLNNFVVGVTRTNISITNTWAPSHELFNAANTGIGSIGDFGSPSVQQIGTPRSMGMGIWNGYVNPMTQNTWDIIDNFTWTKGRHSIKTGLELRNYNEALDQTWGSGGSVGFSDSDKVYGGTGNGIADMMIAGGIGSFSQSSAQHLDVNYPAREAYIQDSFRITPRLMIMVGARLQPYLGVRPTRKNFVTFRPGQPSTVFPTAPTGLVTIGDRGVPDNLSGDRYNVGPRASFAWDILGNHKAALKGGYGLYTDYQVLLGFNGYTSTAPYGVNYSPHTQGLDLTNPYAQYGSVPFPYTAPTAGSPKDASLVFPHPLDTIAIASDFNSGQIHKFNLTFEAEPVNSYVVSVAWVATRGTHLSESNNQNWPRFVAGGSTNDTANILSREPYYPAGFDQINTFSSDYNSMYNSLQIAVNKRYSYGLALMGNYTFSGDTQQQGCRYRAACGLDYYSPGTVHAMAAAFRYQLPVFFRHTRNVSRILDGWAIGGSGNASTGGYGSIGDYNCNEFNFSSAGCYANYLGGGALLGNRKSVVTDPSGKMLGVSWVDPSKFVRADQALINGVPTTLPGVGQRLFLGNAANGVIKGPAAGIEYFNASLDKDFGFAERSKINVHAEAFNALNHTVLNGPGYNNTVGPNTQGFGIISSAQAPRNVQLSLHLIF